MQFILLNLGKNINFNFKEVIDIDERITDLIQREPFYIFIYTKPVLKYFYY